MEKKGILELLREGPVIGDGSYCYVLERRGYVTSGHWTPEAVIEHPEAGNHIEEIEWAIDVLKRGDKPVAATMTLNPGGDWGGVSAGECAVRMVKAGADIVGVNCLQDYKTCLNTVKLMKDALTAENFHPFLMIQPLGFHVPEVEHVKEGYLSLPEMPMALEPRLYTRWDVRKYAREAYELGVRYIGGCCGFEPYHIREMAEELSEERGKRPPGADKNALWGAAQNASMFKFIRKRTTKDYWENLKPAFGRPDCPMESTPDTTQ